MFKKISWKTFWYTNLFSLITLAAGIVFTTKPDIITSACKFLGGLFCLIGAVLLVLYAFPKLRSEQNLVYGILALLAGIVLQVIPTLLKVMIPVLLGGWILISSLSGIYRNLIFRHDVPKWWIGFLLCIASAILAVFLMTRPVSVMNDTVRIIGIGFIIHAAARLISSILGKDGYKAAEADVINTTIQE